MKVKVSRETVNGKVSAAQLVFPLHGFLELSVL